MGVDKYLLNANVFIITTVQNILQNNHKRYCMLKKIRLKG